MGDIESPAIGRRIEAAGITTNYWDEGEGETVLLLHGSGIGVSAYANWHRTTPQLARDFRVLAPDIAGYGFSQPPNDAVYNLDLWVAHMVGFLDALGVRRTHLLGNSFGGAVAIALSARHPELIGRVALMGTVGTEFSTANGGSLKAPFEPTIDNMQRLLQRFTFHPQTITRHDVELRYATHTRPGYEAIFKRLHPPTWTERMAALVTPQAEIEKIKREVLLIHGRDDRIIPTETSLRLHRLLANSDLHLFGNCGHWSHVDRETEFNRLVIDFFCR